MNAVYLEIMVMEGKQEKVAKIVDIRVRAGASAFV